MIYYYTIPLRLFCPCCSCKFALTRERINAECGDAQDPKSCLTDKIFVFNTILNRIFPEFYEGYTPAGNMISPLLIEKYYNIDIFLFHANNMESLTHMFTTTLKHFH